MDALLTSTTLVAGGAHGQVIRDGALALRAGRIVDIGTTAELEERHPDIPRLPLPRRAVVPGLINCHTHTILTVLRGGVEDLGHNIMEVVYG